MSLDSARAIYGLFGRTAPSAPGTTTSEAQTIGVRQTDVPVTGADVAHAFKVTSTGAGNVATWTMESGVVAQSTGTPTITDGDGNDWQGNDNGLTTSSKVYGVLIQAASTNTGTIALDGTSYSEVVKHTMSAKGVVLLLTESAAALGAGSVMSMTFSASGDSVTVTYLAEIAP